MNAPYLTTIKITLYYFYFRQLKVMLNFIKKCHLIVRSQEDTSVQNSTKKCLRLWVSPVSSKESKNEQGPQGTCVLNKNDTKARVEARGWAVQRTDQLRQEHHYNTRGKLHSKRRARRTRAPHEKNLERREPTAGATWNWKACAHRRRCSGVVTPRRTFVQRVRFVQKQF